MQYIIFLYKCIPSGWFLPEENILLQPSKLVLAYSKCGISREQFVIQHRMWPFVCHRLVGQSKRVIGYSTQITTSNSFIQLTTIIKWFSMVKIGKIMR